MPDSNLVTFDYVMGNGSPSSEERFIRAEAWHESGLSKFDAIHALAKAWEQIDRLEEELGDAKIDLQRERDKFELFHEKVKKATDDAFKG